MQLMFYTFLLNWTDQRPWLERISPIGDIEPETIIGGSTGLTATKNSIDDKTRPL